MPNWIEGTMKVRGKTENVIRFLKEGLNDYILDFSGDDVKEIVKDKNEWGIVSEDEKWFELDIVGSMIYIEESHRAFVLPSTVWIDKEEEKCTICLSVKKAWSFDSYSNGKEWREISKRYDVDIRLFGFERGMQFGQEMVVENGLITYFETMKYDDYEWECPFPFYGG